ncbi:MAG TPA: hypothetical protein VF720_02905 [Candidatus Eisenbacteria bacterium]
MSAKSGRSGASDKPSGKSRPKSPGSGSGSGSGRSRRSGQLDRFAGSPWALIPTFLLALAIRFIHLDQMNSYEDFRTPILDEAFSWDLASRFLAGFGSVGRPFDADPGVALFVSVLVRVVGTRPDLVLACLAVLGSGAAVLVQLLGNRVLGGAAGLFCGLIAAVYRPAIHHGAHVVDAAFVPFVAALALLLMAIQSESKRPLPELISGFLGGAATMLLVLFQAPLIILAPIVLVVLIFDRKMKIPQKLRRGLSFSAGALGVMALLTVLNSPAAHGAGSSPFLFRNVVPPGFGREFHLANRDGNRAGDRLPPHWAPADPAGLAAAYVEEGARVSALEGHVVPLTENARNPASVNAVAIDRAWSDRTGREAAGHPWGFLSGWAWRAWRNLNGAEAPGPYDMAWESGRSWILRLPFPGWALLLPLALAGVMAARGASKDPALTLVVVWGVAVFIAIWPFAVTSRARMAIEPALIVLAVRGAMRLFGLVGKRDMPALARAGLVVGIAAILVRLPVGGTGPAPFHRLMGQAYESRGAIRAASEHRDEAERRSRGDTRLGR